MRGHPGIGELVAGVVGVLAVGALTGGCATVEYRVPSSEVQRLAQLPPEARGSEIRVVPANTPEGPPLTAAAVAPQPPPVQAVPLISEPPAELPIEAEPPPEPPPAPPEVAGVAVDVDVGPPPVRLAAPRVVVTPARAPIARPPAFRAPVARAPAVRAPPVVRTGGGSGGGHGSAHGGNIGGGAALVALVVLPIIVIAIVANAVAVANAHAAEARAFDGWVTVTPDHLLRLRYGGNLERLVPLTTLCGSDLVGVRYAVLRETDGPITRRNGYGR
jgi:hypothetical protein